MIEKNFSKLKSGKMGAAFVCIFHHTLEILCRDEPFCCGKYLKREWLVKYQENIFAMQEIDSTKRFFRNIF